MDDDGDPGRTRLKHHASLSAQDRVSCRRRQRSARDIIADHVFPGRLGQRLRGVQPLRFLLRCFTSNQPAETAYRRRQFPGGAGAVLGGFFLRAGQRLLQVAHGLGVLLGHDAQGFSAGTLAVDLAHGPLPSGSGRVEFALILANPRPRFTEVRCRQVKGVLVFGYRFRKGRQAMIEGVNIELQSLGRGPCRVALCAGVIMGFLDNFARRLKVLGMPAGLLQCVGVRGKLRVCILCVCSRGVALPAGIVMRVLHDLPVEPCLFKPVNQLRL